MNVRELREALADFDPEAPVGVWDSNGDFHVLEFVDTVADRLTKVWTYIEPGSVELG